MSRVLHILPHEGGGGEALVDLLEELHDFEHERIHLSASREPLRGAPSIALGRARLRERARTADLLHVVGDAAAMIALPVLRRRPAAVGTHGLHLLRRVHGVSGAVVRRRMRAVLASAEVVVCSSRPELEELAALDPGARLRVVVNGTRVPAAQDDEARRAARVELGLGERDVAGLYLGQLEERKRPLDAVGAAELAASRGAPFVLLVAGEGPLAGAVAARAGAAVRPLGFRQDPERLLAAADVFVLPSEREGLSLALLEAMARQLAVVVSDGAGNPEAVGDAGLVVPLGDVTALADALTRLAADAHERVRLGALARRRVESEFSTGRYLDALGDVFTDVLRAGAGSQP
jgi:glycosyltransferase involved in cell wall biosynthesis